MSRSKAEDYLYVIAQEITRIRRILEKMQTEGE